jgi:hypothetical protein
VQRHAVHDRAHGMLAHAEMEVAAARLSGAKTALPLMLREVGAGEVGRAADQLRHRRRDGVQHHARTPRGWPRCRCPRRTPAARSHCAGRSPCQRRPRNWPRSGTPWRTRRRLHPRGLQARRVPWPAPVLERAAGTKNGSVLGHPYFTLVSAISSLPSGSPCALAVSARLGEPKPMTVRVMISVGCAVSAWRRRWRCRSTTGRSRRRCAAPASRTPRSAWRDRRCTRDRCGRRW